jgi:BASS family bile acid:Na+ symporter
MEVEPCITSRIARFLHRHLLGLIVFGYVLAAFLPVPGLWLRRSTLAHLGAGREGADVTVPTLLVGFLLLSAGLRVRVEQLRQTLTRPKVVCVGLLANLGVPLSYVVLATMGLRLWHNAAEAQSLVVGLALVVAMPIAGSSAGWAQQNEADLSVSLGLVLFSTLLSPLTTPLLLRAAGLVTGGAYSARLEDLAGAGTGTFLILWVVLPSVLGLGGRLLLGEARVARLGDGLRLGNTLSLFTLCYSNAAVCLPQVVRHPDWDLLGLSLGMVAGLCMIAFASGAILGRALDAGRPQRVALVFGLGMNNNGTGLVLASMTMGSDPIMMLPIVLYNLVQHVAAGCVSSLMRASLEGEVQARSAGAAPSR